MNTEKSPVVDQKTEAANRLSAFGSPLFQRPQPPVPSPCIPVNTEQSQVVDQKTEAANRLSAFGSPLFPRPQSLAPEFPCTRKNRRLLIKIAASSRQSAVRGRRQGKDANTEESTVVDQKPNVNKPASRTRGEAKQCLTNHPTPDIHNSSPAPRPQPPAPHLVAGAWAPTTA